MSALPGCNCANCRRWTAESRPDPLPADEQERKREGWEAARRAWRAEHPLLDPATGLRE